MTGKVSRGRSRRPPDEPAANQTHRTPANGMARDGRNAALSRPEPLSNSGGGQIGAVAAGDRDDQRRHWSVGQSGEGRETWTPTYWSGRYEYLCCGVERGEADM